MNKTTKLIVIIIVNILYKQKLIQTDIKEREINLILLIFFFFFVSICS